MMAFRKGVGDHGVFEAAGREPEGAPQGRVRGRGEPDVEGDVDVRGQRDGVERGEEEAGHRAEEWLVRGVRFDCCWRGLGALGFRRGGGWFLFVSVLSARGTGRDHGERMRRGTHQVSDMSRDCRSSWSVSDRLTGFGKGGEGYIQSAPLEEEHGDR